MNSMHDNDGFRRKARPARRESLFGMPEKAIWKHDKARLAMQESPFGRVIKTIRQNRMTKPAFH